MSIESVMPSSHLILYCPLFLLPSIFPSIRVFSDESAHCIRWPKYWSFNFNISPSNEHPGLISFRMDWLDLLAVQGTLKSLLQNHSSKASILWCSAFFIVQLSHLYVAAGKAIDWPIRDGWWPYCHIQGKIYRKMLHLIQHREKKSCLNHRSQRAEPTQQLKAGVTMKFCPLKRTT